MNDEIFCAYTVPYTYTQMQTHIKQLKLLSSNSRKYASNYDLYEAY
jgi:hypothetical protein